MEDSHNAPGAPINQTWARHWFTPVMVVLPVAIALSAGPRLLDDAYITLRYARSIADGDGFVYNVGEHVLGTTTPLFALLLGGLHWISGLDLVWLAFGCALLGHIAVMLLVTNLGRVAGYVWAGRGAALLFGLAPIAWNATLGGMEASLFTAAALYALAPQPNQSGIQSLAAAGAQLLRPEGAIVLALHLLREGCRGWRPLVRALCVCAVGVLPWLAFATLYFGSAVPQSMRAKWLAAQWVPARHAAESFWYVLLSAPSSAPPLPLDSLSAHPFGELTAEKIQLGWSLPSRYVLVVAGGGIVLLLVAVGLAALVRRNRHTLWPLLFASLYCGAYCWANPYIFPWYLVPPMPVVGLGLTVGLERLVRRISSGAARSAAALGLVVALGGVGIWQINRFVRNPPPGRERAYFEAVQRLGAPAQDRQVLIGVLETGVIGYAARARILDHFGLVSGGVLLHSPDAVVEYFHPDYYIAADLYVGMFGLHDCPAFAEHYEPIAAIPAEPKESGYVRVYIRR